MWTSPDSTPVTNPGEKNVWSMLSSFLSHLPALVTSVYFLSCLWILRIKLFSKSGFMFESQSKESSICLIIKYLNSYSSYWPSGRIVISLAIFQLINISQEDWGGSARIIQIIYPEWVSIVQKWCKPKKHLTQSQQENGTMFLLLHTEM